jgi:hypothetical protein
VTAILLTTAEPDESAQPPKTKGPTTRLTAPAYSKFESISLQQRDTNFRFRSWVKTRGLPRLTFAAGATE